MLLANKLVGKKLVDTYREAAVLRSHPFPKDKKVNFFRKLLESFNMETDFDFTDNLSI